MKSLRKGVTGRKRRHIDVDEIFGKQQKEKEEEDEDDDVIDLTDLKPSKPSKSPRKFKQAVISVDDENELVLDHHKHYSGGVNIMGFDPGEVSIGISIYSITHAKIVDGKEVKFRETGEEMSLGELIDKTREYIEKDPDGLFANSTHTYIEAQLSQRNVAVQHAVQTMLGSKKCTVVQANSLKSWFGKFFPTVVGATTQEQYRINKKYAVISGVATLSPVELNSLPHRNGRWKKMYDHNLMDSVWLARYACEVFYKTKSFPASEFDLPVRKRTKRRMEMSEAFPNKKTKSPPKETSGSAGTGSEDTFEDKKKKKRYKPFYTRYRQ